MKKPKHYNNIISLGDYNSFQDCNPIIDYIQLWTNKIPASWIVAIEDTENRLDFGKEEYIMEDQDNKKFKFTLKSGERLTINKPIPKKKNEKKATKPSYSASLHIPSKSLDILEYKYLFKYLKGWIKNIKPLHTVEYKSAKINSNKFHTVRMPSMMDLNDWTISRIDLGINISNALDLEALEWQTHKRTSIHKYYVTTNKEKEISGVTVGKRGNQFLFCRLYKKWLDPNREHDIIKYGTSEFFRLEYELRRPQIKKVENGNTGRCINSVNDLTEHNILKLWKYVTRLRHPIFKDSELPRYIIKTMKGNPNTDNTHQIRYNMIMGLMKPYKLYYNIDYEKGINNINTLFGKVGCIIKKDVIEKYNSKLDQNGL